MTTLLVLYPALAGAVTSRRGEVITLHNPARACYFLQDDNRCGLEVRHGKQLKPGLCTLFPFNNFSRLGQDIVVLAPHLLCPLRVVLPRSDKAEGGHQRVIQAAKDSFLLDRGEFSAGVPPLPLPPHQTPHGALRQETGFRDACSEGLQVARFSEVLARCSTEAAELKRFQHRAALVCGVVPAAPHDRDELDDILLVLAPVWRLRMLSLGRERMLRVLALAELLIRRLASLSTRATTPQQADQFYSEVLPACQLLSRNESPMSVPERLRKLASFGTADLTFTAYQALRAAERSVLVAFEEAFAQSTPTHDRMAILMELGRHCTDETAPSARNDTEGPAPPG